jgi:hypothetical protein
MNRSMRWSGLLLAAMVTLPTGAWARGLDVEISTDRGDDGVYDSGDKIEIKARASDDAYLLVYDIDAEGNVRLLFPTGHRRGYVEGGKSYRLPTDDADADLVVQGPVGQGYIVAIASIEPFRDLPRYLRPYDPQGDEVGYYGEPEDEDNGVTEGGRIVGDPFVAMERIRRQVVEDSQDEESFATAYATYYVHQQVRYPRYLCYDCHRPNQWSWWDGFDPYYTSCSVFTFRLNWGWTWGPQYWFGYVPYYVYLYRHDCPPGYRSDYGAHYSSWDGWARWNNLWGAHLTRYKSDPPAGYVPPSKFDERSRWRDNGVRPPGFLAGGRVPRPGLDPRAGRTLGSDTRARRGDLRDGTGTDTRPQRFEPRAGDPLDRMFRRSDRSGNREEPAPAPAPARRGRSYEPTGPAFEPRRSERPPRADRSSGFDGPAEPRPSRMRVDPGIAPESSGPPGRQAGRGYGMPRVEPSTPPRSQAPSGNFRGGAPAPSMRAPSSGTFWRSPPASMGSRSR